MPYYTLLELSDELSVCDERLRIPGLVPGNKMHDTLLLPQRTRSLTDDALRGLMVCDVRLNLG